MTTCILLAGGIGSRTDLSIPKQFVEIEGLPLFAYSAITLNQHEYIDSIIIVGLESWKDYIESWVKKLNLSKVKFIVNQGISRQHSIFNGLKKAKEYMQDSDIIMIHDAARPHINKDVIKSTVDSAIHNGSAIAVTQVSDAIYYSDDNQFVSRVLPKASVFNGQTPVCINFGIYYDLHLKSSDEILLSCSGSCTILFLHNIKVAIVDGDNNTFKISYKEDIDRFKAYLRCNNTD